MKIGFDAKRVFLNNTGLGNYSRWLINGLLKYQRGNQYYLYTPKLSSRYLPDKELIVKIPKLKLFTSRWRSSGIINNLVHDDIQLYHGLSHELPLGVFRKGIKSVVTVHDLIFMRYPQYFNRINRFIYKAKLVNACRFADRIIAVSQKTKDDLVELLQVDANKIEVIYQSCDPSFKAAQTPEQLQAIKAKYNLPDEYLLCVGTIEERKNLLLLVKALKQVDNITLVVVGKPTKYLNEVKTYIDTNKMEGRIIFLHSVAFADLPAIYQQAICFVYPSRYEGFGIPVLEALVSGVPVIAAKGTCLEEAGGPDSIYIDPDNENGLAEKINLILSELKLREHMVTKGLQYSDNFDDEKLIAQYAGLYNDVLNHA